MSSSIPKGYSIPDVGEPASPMRTAKVYQFDPDASPQQKAAAAAKGKDQLKPVNGAAPKPAFEGKGPYLIQLIQRH